MADFLCGGKNYRGKSREKFDRLASKDDNGIPFGGLKLVVLELDNLCNEYKYFEFTFNYYSLWSKRLLVVSLPDALQSVQLLYLEPDLMLGHVFG